MKKKVKALIFDYDGVFTNNTIWLMEDGSQMRTGNTRDGFAIKKLIEKGYTIAIISGAKSEGIRKRLEYIGVPSENIYLEVGDKLNVFKLFAKENNLSSDEVFYMGDDLLDLPLLEYVGFPFCPADAIDAVLNVATTTLSKGGEGCIREIAEKYFNILN